MRSLVTVKIFSLSREEHRVNYAKYLILRNVYKAK